MSIIERKLRVFLCYASQDRPIVRELYEQLISEDWIEPWLDKEKLLPGHDWNLEIERAVELSDTVIACLSNNSVSKEGYVQKELRKVLEVAKEKPDGTMFVIPLRLDDCQIPRNLQALQYADYFPQEQRTKTFQEILKSLDVRLNSLLPVKSMESNIGYGEGSTQLIQQENNILSLILEGKTDGEIANTLFLSEDTVHGYIESILSKLRLSRPEQVAEFASKKDLKEIISFSSRRNSIYWSIKKGIRIVRIEFGRSENEYVQMENPGMLPINMTNWILYDNAGNKFKFPSFVLRGKSFVRIWTGGGMSDQSNLYWGRKQSVWNKNGDTVYLEDNRGSIVCTISY